MILDWERDNLRKRPKSWIKDEEKARKTDPAAKFLQAQERLVPCNLYKLKLASRSVKSGNNFSLLPKAKTEAFTRLVRKLQK